MQQTYQHGTLRLQVYNKLRENILRGHYPRGSALTEIRVSQEMGVSRTPIREAFCQLELDGLVKATPNKGVVVRGFDETDILDLYEVRTHMESLAAARAAVNMSDSQRQGLRQAFAQELGFVQTGDIEGLQQADSHFHDLIFQGSGSPILQNILSPITTYTRQARFVSLSAAGRSQQVLCEHERILEAILSRDHEAARLRMMEHIANAAASYRRLSAETGGQT